MPHHQQALSACCTAGSLSAVKLTKEACPRQHYCDIEATQHFCREVQWHPSTDAATSVHSRVRLLMKPKPNLSEVQILEAAPAHLRWRRWHLARQACALLQPYDAARRYSADLQETLHRQCTVLLQPLTLISSIMFNLRARASPGHEHQHHDN